MSSSSSYKREEIESQNFANEVYNYDWSSTPLGPMDSWDAGIKTATSLCLKSVFPICLFIGSPYWIQLYNKAWEPILQSKPYAIGKSVKETWPEVSDLIVPMFEGVRTSKKGIYRVDDYYELHRDGYIEEAYFDYTYSPVFKLDGSVWAVSTIAQETTQKVLTARRLKILGEFGRKMPEIESLEKACHITTDVLNNNKDIPYALVYFVESKLNTGSRSMIARLTSTTFDKDDKNEYQFPDYFPDTPKIIDLSKVINNYDDKYVTLKRHVATYSFLNCEESWPLDLVIKKEEPVKVILKDGSQAVLLLANTFCGDQSFAAILICGINRLRTLDEKYLEFLQLVLNQMNTCLLQGKTREEEKKRAKLLADLNSQKVMFFQGISHELKTPLTLMLSPLEDVINISAQGAPIMSYLQIVRRNARRLLKLINALLQFSSLETDQFKTSYRETNIVEYTKELASDFKNMAKKLNLEYNIDIPSPDEFNQAVDDKIYLDRDMYETILSNLCSNALKHTWNGSITVRLYLDYKDNKKMIALEVSDTGVGIPESVLPNIFQRFYRVESQGSRSHEGTGIGLALVKELLTRHGGDITVTSVINQGTTFKCWLPIGCDHLPKNQIYSNRTETQTSDDQELYSNRQLYLEESSQWINDGISESQENKMDQVSTKENMDIDNTNINKMLTKDNLTTSKKYQILLVEDNADMRDYLAELLKEFDIHRARDGKDALRVLKKLNKLPDLILSDIMMPNMDGYQLLEVLRTDKRTQTIPIILVSARACEDSRVLGLDKGADDYLSKPFSARDLIARVRTNINLSILRRKIIFQQCRQEEIKQLLLLISEKVTSKLNLDETLQYVAKELYQILPCEKILIISNKHIESISNRIVALFEGSENITNSSSEIDDYYESESQNISNIQEFLKNNPGIDISFNVYCDDVCKDASILSVEIKLNNNIWGWIKAYRPSNSIWLVSEIELLQQISNQISLAVTYANLLEENAEKDIQIKAAEAASITKSQILANTSHELRTPLGAIVGILSSFDRVALTADQNDMINIMSRASDIVLSIINDILDAARLEAQKLTLINRTFYLSNLLEVTIEKFGKRAGAKNIELILNYDVDEVSRYVKSDPERLEQVLSHLLSNSVKFTDKGEIVLKISMQSRDVIDENEENPTYGQILKKENLLVELYDTGIGIDPKYAQNAWKSYSQGDMSVTKKQDGTGLGLSICKSLVEINGGEIKVESQLGKGSKFWFTWNIESLSITSSLFISQFDEINDLMKEKRILVIHPIESMRDAMLKYLKNFNKVDAFDSFDKGINAARRHEELYNKPAYDIAFISLYEDNEAEVMKAVLELKILINHNSLVIIFITFPSNTGIEVAEKLIRKTGGKSFVIYTPITWKKLINQFMHIYQYNIS